MAARGDIMARDVEMDKYADSSSSPTALFDVLEMLNERDEKPGSDDATEQDVRDMYRMGNKQQFKRNFHSFSILGLTCVLISTWMAVLSTSEFSLINGGRAGTIYVFLASWICTLTVVASLAEMASMAPTAGGQYHWVSEFAPASFQKPFSYVAGWLAALGWQTFIGGSAYQTAVVILLMASTGNPSYQPTLWQETLLTIFVGFVALMFNLFAARRLPLFEGVVLCLYILGFFAIAIPLWVLAPKVPTKEVFTSFENFGGWPNMAVAFVVGQSSAANSLIGVDSATHMSEEVRSASKTVPRMMFFTIILNGVLGFVLLISYVFVIQDIPSQIVGSTSPFPYIGVFQSATQSSTAAIGMTLPICLLAFSMCINSVMAASRQAWAFARDDGLPFSSWFARVSVVDGTPLPVNAMVASMPILFVIALLNLGGSLIVNSIVGLVTGAVGTTYCLSIGCVLWRRLFGDPLPPARWSLGWFGLPINLFAFFYQAFSTIMSFFPLFVNPGTKGMNWSVVVFGGVILIAAINYAINGRRIYKGPVVRIVKDD